MPAYTILMMRADATDRRPARIHINRVMFWILVGLAVGLPIGGFFLSVGWIAPSWLRYNVATMETAVAEAEGNLQPLQQQNAQLAERLGTVEAQLTMLRTQLAEAETRATVAETAHQEASGRVAELETEAVNMKQSLARFEAMLKPKLQTELIACNDLDVIVRGDKVHYETTFSRTRNATNVPANLTVQVRVAGGDNLMLLEQAKQAGSLVTHTLEMARDSKVEGTIPMAKVPSGNLRMLDLKVMDGDKTVGYCWNNF